MRVTRREVVLGAIVLSLQPTLARAHGYNHGGIEIAHPWCADTFVDGTRDVVVGMDIKSKNVRGDRLIRSDSKVATSVEMRDQNGTVVPSLIVPGNGTMTLGHNGAHIRLVGLKKPLVIYDTLRVSLLFERAGRISVDVLVEETIEAKS